MEKELTKAQLTFVDLYDSYTLSLSSDVIAVPCDAEGEALSTKIYTIDYQVRAGESNIASVCESAELSTEISNVTVDKSTAGKISVEVKTTAKIPEDSGIYIKIKTNDGNDFIFERFISFMNIKKGQDGEPGRGYSSMIDQYAITTELKEPQESDWRDVFISPTEDSPYLWNREIFYYDTYTNGVQDSYTTQSRLISTYGRDGKPGLGYKSVVEYYAASNSGETINTSQQYMTGSNTVTVTEVGKTGNIVGLQQKAAGYYSINMLDQNAQEVSNSYSLIQLKYHITQPTQIVISCVSYGEIQNSTTAYDYMVVSKCNSDYTQVELSKSSSIASDTLKLKRNFQTNPSSGPSGFEDVVFETVEPGTYYVYIKVIKDVSQTRDGETFEFKCMERKIDWQTSVPSYYGPDYPYLWNYLEFTYTDNSISTTPPHLSSHWGLDAFALKVVTDKGDVFTDGIEEITLSLEAYSGESKINMQVPYEWSYYTFDRGDGDNWTTLASGKANIEDISLTVKISDPYAYSMFKCEIGYNGVSYSDYETLKQDVQDVYYAETKILDDDLDGNCVVMYTEVAKNGNIVDPLLTNKVYFVNKLGVTGNSTGDYFTSDGSTDITQESHEDGDLAYLVSYRYVSYLEAASSADEENYAYRSEGNTIYNREAQDGELPYAFRSSEKNIYHLVLAKYDGNSKRWRPYNTYDTNDYCYINEVSSDVLNFTFSNAKVFVVDKRYLSQSQSLSVTIHQKVHDNNKTFKYYVPFQAINLPEVTAYDIWKIYNYRTGEDTRLFYFNSTVFQSVKISYMEECFTQKTDGVYITRKISTVDSNGEVSSVEPFYVKISSDRMGFWSQTYDSENRPVQDPIEMVHIGNNSTNIRNSQLEGNTTLDGDITIFKKNKDNGAFVIQRESDGGISLVLG